MARLKPSRASAPSAENGPEMSLAMPTLTASAMATAGTSAATAIREVIKRMVVCSVREPAQRVFL